MGASSRTGGVASAAASVHNLSGSMGAAVGTATGITNTSTAGSNSSRGCASAYLLDVLQQVREANSYCRQLGLSSQYRLAKGSSRKDRWQLEQIKVELWSVVQAGGSSSSNSVPQQHQQPGASAAQAGPASAASTRQGAEGVGGAGAGGAGPASDDRLSEWRLKRTLSLQQFTKHLGRLKGTGGGGSSATAAAAKAGGASRGSRPSMQHSSRGAASAAAAQRCLQPFVRAARSPDRMGRSSGGGSISAGCQLLVLSPRGGVGGGSTQPVQCLLQQRPGSAQQARRSRLSPRRQQ